MVLYEPATSPIATAEALAKATEMIASWKAPTKFDNTVVKGDGVTVSGTLRDAVTKAGLGGKEIYVHPIKIATTLADGSFSFVIGAATSPGTYPLKVEFRGDAEWAPSSAETAIIVEARTPNLTISMPTSGKPGESVSWPGRMTDPKVTTYGIPGKDIYLQESTDGVTFTDVAGPVKTGSDGSHGGTYALPTVPDTYYYRSRFPGGSPGAQHEVATSPVVAVTVSEVVTPPPEIPIEYIIVGTVIVAVIIGGVIYYFAAAM